jgi:antitoxin component YwqK of YwqJK toxin-antitoxin module
MLRSIVLMLLCIVFITGCRNEFEERREIPDQVVPENNLPETNPCSLPACNSKEGIKLNWEIIPHPVMSQGIREIITRSEFLEQIPAKYSGYLKLCEDNEANTGACNGLHYLIKCTNGIVDGVSYHYAIDGKAFEEIYFKNGIAEGTWVYYNAEKEIVGVNNYKNGKLHGICETYNDKLMITLKCNYKNGELDGKYFSYFDDLNLAEKSNYKNGKLDGEAYTYYENGNIKDFNEYKQGLAYVTKHYLESGELFSEKYRDKNFKIIKWLVYDEFGNPNPMKFYERDIEIKRP